ncbi:MAG: hypothetical protein KC418_05675 [Anaerolineales bacterium]|nr:hypothetical protein [Anaerolineales bacterium]MCB8951444.1 hypothetical protein [Ardenticatenales bacterium]
MISRPTTTAPARNRPRQAFELEVSFVVIFILCGVYIAYEIVSEPRGGHPFGHWLGIVGTLLMLMTETLYSLRKRTTLLNRAGPVRYWLSFHIFTGLVGPFLVLMHTGLQFRGLAGLTFWLTMVVVASGFVGRYLYTALPRRLSGVAQSHAELTAEANNLHASLTAFQQEKPDHVQAVITALSERTARRSAWLSLLGRSFFQWRYERRLRRELRRLDELESAQQKELAAMLARQRELERQMETLETARGYMRLWHMAHVPLGLTLFFSVIVHIVATVYFRAGILH